MRQGIIESLSDLEHWARLSIDKIRNSAPELGAYIGGGFDFLSVEQHGTGLNIATFGHRMSGVEFNVIPGGDFLLGLSDDEYQVAKEIPGADLEVLERLRPATKVHVNPFLISRLPLLEGFVEDAINVDWSIYRPDFQPTSDEKTGEVPIYLSRHEVAAILAKYNFSLPTESQWEYATRGGTTTPFYFGTDIGDEAMLTEVMNTDLRRIDDNLSSNPFGVVGMLVGGWCQDSWAAKRWSGEDVGPPYVIRSGAATYWPWQGAGEWMLALSAMRRSSEELEDETCSAHVVSSIGK